MSIRVVTDSGCDLPQPLVDALAHRDRPAHHPLRRRGARRPRGAEHRRVLAPARALRSCCRRPRRRRPARSRAGSGSCTARGATGIVCINLSSHLSATMQAAQVAAAAVPSDVPVQVIDSQSASMGLGNLCLTAARRAADGDSLESIVHEVVDRRDRTKLFATLDTLEFLQAGRPDRQRTRAARLDAVDQAGHRGPRRRSSRRRARCARGRRRSSCSPRRPPKGKIEHLAVLHGNAPDLDELLDLLEPIFPRDEIITGVVGPVIGTHAGPRVIGVTFQAVRERHNAAVELTTPGRVLGGRYRLVEPHRARRHGDGVGRRRPGAVAPRRGEDPAAPTSRPTTRPAARFRHEAIAAARLSHPNIVSTYDTGDDDGIAYIVMELVDGPDAAPAASTSTAASPSRDVIRIGKQVADALDAAHRAGLVHRDVKPANVLVPPAGPVKVTDFGIAKAAGGDDLTRTGTVMGTARYLAPEQVNGRPDRRRAPTCTRSGSCSTRCSCGQPPFGGDTDIATAMARLTTSAPADPRRAPRGVARRSTT